MTATAIARLVVLPALTLRLKPVLVAPTNVHRAVLVLALDTAGPGKAVGSCDYGALNALVGG